MGRPNIVSNFVGKGEVTRKNISSLHEAVSMGLGRNSVGKSTIARHIDQHNHHVGRVLFAQRMHWSTQLRIFYGSEFFKQRGPGFSASVNLVEIDPKSARALKSDRDVA